MQNAVFGFMVDLDQIREHNYENTKSQLKKKMCSFFFNMFCDVFLLVWVNLIVRNKYLTSALYLTEKIWLILWTSTQFTCYFIAFFASWFAVCKPQILLNASWNRVVGKMYMFFLYFQLIIFMNVVIIDIWKFVFYLTPIHFTGGDADDGESTLNLIVRMT